MTIKILLVYNLNAHPINLTEVGALEKFYEISYSLTAAGFTVELCNIEHSCEKLISAIKSSKADLVFNLIEDVNQSSFNDATVAGIFDWLKIAYIGSDAQALSFTTDKHRAKLLMKAAGIKTPAWHYFAPTDSLIEAKDLKFPVIVKPYHEDASIGIDEQSIVLNQNDLNERVKYIFDSFKQGALAEEFIDGREINAAYLGDENKIALPLSEIDYSSLPHELPKILSYDAKWSPESISYRSIKTSCPALVSDALKSQIDDMCRSVISIFGCRDYCRVDLRIDSNDQPYILEVNVSPDLDREAGFFRASQAHGLSYQGMLIAIVNCALKRSKK